MNKSRVVVFISICLASIQMLLAHSSGHGNGIEANIYVMSRDLGDHFIHTADCIDSLKATLSDEELEEAKVYFDYTDAYVAFMKGNFNKTLRLSESALQHFLYNEQNEWAARCLLLIGNTASAKRLIPEAIRAYRRVVEFSDDPHNLSSAYLNLAKNLNSLKRDWHESFRLAEHYCQMTGDEHVALNAQLVSYWLHPDSVRMVIDLPILAEKFNKLEHYTREADAYKCLVMFYSNKGEYENALVYVNKSIEAYNKEERPSKVLLSSVFYLKGQVLMALGMPKSAYLEFNKALAINSSGGYRGSNYQIYLTMYSYEYGVENYKDACFFLRIANKSFEYLSNDKLAHYHKMTTIFSEIKLIVEELEDIKAQSARRIVLTSTFLIFIFTLVISWMISRKRHYERRSVDMESKNTKLKEETGELLLRSNQNQLTSKIIKSQSVVERKMAKFLSQNEIMPGIIKEKYAETMLCFDVKLQILSDTEKRYAVMIALDIPYKSISEILNVKPQTVAQYRNRLRKKLGIVNTEIDLNVYLKTFLEE